MENYQKEVQIEQLAHEEKIREALAANYKAALKEIKKQILDMTNNPSFQPEKIMQIKYQMMLEAQLETILHKLGERNVSDMTNYLETVYHEAYLGCLYGMHKDGVDLILQVDEEKVKRVVSKETQELKFSERIYNNVNQLKEETKSELARGISTGKDYLSIARQIAVRTGISLKRAYTIARTEGGRVQSEADMDCMHGAIEAGADVVKEWVSTLDDVTRNTHRELDGQIRELDEEFVIPSSGARAMYPCGFGIAREDINCRCCMNQRARWNLESERYRFSRFSGNIVSIEADEYKQWKEKYQTVIAGMDNSITDKDKKAIFDYMSFDSYPLNEALRKGIPLTDRQRKLVENLDKALDKMPAYYGNLSRSLDFRSEEELQEFVKSMKVGEIKTSAQYISCTYGEAYNPAANVQLFIKNAAKGKDISKYNEKEKEVLYKREVKFHVKNATIKDGVYYFLLEEYKDE